jgi:hypothetical protein
MAAQMELGRPIQGVPIERVDHWATSGSDWMANLDVTRALSRLHTNEPPPANPDFRQDAWMLRVRGFDRVLVTHRRTGADGAAMTLLQRAFGEPLVNTPHGSIWAVPEVEASEEELATWRAALAAGTRSENAVAGPPGSP